jgi:hypothetical protein
MLEFLLGYLLGRWNTDLELRQPSVFGVVAWAAGALMCLGFAVWFAVIGAWTGFWILFVVALLFAWLSFAVYAATPFVAQPPDAS